MFHYYFYTEVNIEFPEHSWLPLTVYVQAEISFFSPHFHFSVSSRGLQREHRLHLCLNSMEKEEKLAVLKYTESQAVSNQSFQNLFDKKVELVKKGSSNSAGNQFSTTDCSSASTGTEGCPVRVFEY